MSLALRTCSLRSTVARASLSSLCSSAASRNFTSLNNACPSAQTAACAPAGLPSQRRRLPIKTGGALLATASVAAAYTYHARNKSTAAAKAQAEADAGKDLLNTDTAGIIRSIRESTGAKTLPELMSSLDIKLYQYATCPFCSRTRAALDFFKVPYSIVEVHPFKKKSDLAFSPQYQKVPILTINGVQINDSANIVKQLNALLNDFKPPAERHIETEDEKKWQQFVGDRLIRYTSTNIYRTLSESMAASEFIAREYTGSVNPVQRAFYKLVGAVAMYGVTHRITMKKYNIKDARTELYDLIREWTESGLRGSQFRSQRSTPDLSDVAAFGIFRALKPFETGKDILNPQNVPQQFISWFERMEQHMTK